MSLTRVFALPAWAPAGSLDACAKSTPSPPQRQPPRDDRRTGILDPKAASMFTSIRRHRTSMT
jgi:hypothetical protein